MIDKAFLDDLYARCNRREFVHPDPLELLYRYDDPADREVVGLIAASLAYGRVSQILVSVGKILGALGPHPAKFISENPRLNLNGFKHRFTTGAHMADLLCGIAGVRRQYGSLAACFVNGYEPSEPTLIPVLCRFIDELGLGCGGRPPFLLPSPDDKSACKRMWLYLRWMVRSDDVDPGGWNEIPPAKLIVPLDVHMHRICTELGLTRRKSADLRCAVEITDAFRAIEPADPVKYDFALTRFGIHPVLRREGIRK